MTRYAYRVRAGSQILPLGGALTTRSQLARYTVTPAASTATAVKAAIALTASAQPTVTAGITSPAVPRCLSVTGNAGGIAGNVVITGTDMAGAAITDTIALSGSSTVAGTKAFATVTSIAYPAETNAGTDTVSIGTTDKLGLPAMLPHNTVERAYYNNVLEGTAATVTVSSTVLSSNTVDLNTALAGAIVDVYLFV